MSNKFVVDVKLLKEAIEIALKNINLHHNDEIQRYNKLYEKDKKNWKWYNTLLMYIKPDNLFANRLEYNERKRSDNTYQLLDLKNMLEFHVNQTIELDEDTLKGIVIWKNYNDWKNNDSN